MASPNGTIGDVVAGNEGISAWVTSEAAANENHRIISLRQNHRMSTNAIIRTKRCILVVAQQIELRARIARVLHSAGYSKRRN
jgi:hypothetical protein